MQKINSLLELSKKYSKSLFVGGVSALVQIAGLFVLHELMHIHYVIAGAVALLHAIAVNFTLQKQWVFETSIDKKSKFEFLLFLLLTGCNLVLNSALLYIGVHFFQVHYLVSQAVIILVLSVLNFYMYGKIFKQTLTP